MRNFLTGLLLFVLVGAVFITYLCVFIVDESRTALVIRFGEIKRTVDERGLHFKLPIDQVLLIDRRILFLESSNLKVLVEDDRFYEVDAITMYRIADVQKFRETLNADIDRARSRIGKRLEDVLRQTYGKRSFVAALTKDRSNMMREISTGLKAETAALGIEIVDVRIRRTELGQKVLESTYARMKEERHAEAEQIRAVGRAENTRIKSEAERKAIEMEVGARRQAEIIKGEGDAERNRVFAEAFSKDPEFFTFYRSMRAYQESLKGGNTNLVLSPNSEFFRYLRNPTGQIPKE